MKVCAVTTWPPHRDGVALYSSKLFKDIAKSVDVEVVGNIPKGEESDRFKEDGVSVSRCWRRGAGYPFQIFHSILKSRGDLVHAQHGWLLYGDFVFSLFFPVLLLLIRVIRKPCVVTMHTIVRRDAEIYSNKMVNLLAQIAVQYVSLLILKISNKVVVHNSLMKQILQQGYGFDERKISVIPHGVKKAPKKLEDNQEEENPSILSLGFLRESKGIEYLIEAFEKLLVEHPKARLVIVGGAHAHDHTGYWERISPILTSEVRDQILFTGFVDEKRLEKIIRKSTVIVLQSTVSSYVEVSGALATIADYGKAVICSRVPKFQWGLTDSKDCILVDPSSSRELARALLLLVEDDTLRKHLGENLKENVRNRYWRPVAEKHIKLYNTIL